MTAPFKTWTVLPHGELVRVTETVATVVGEIHMPIGEFPRRMTVIRLGDGRLIIFSAIALDDGQMQRLEAFGRPAFMIVPSDRHRLDAPAWKDRYPQMLVITPAGSREKVAEVVNVDAVEADFGDRRVFLMDVPGTGRREAAMEVEDADGLTLIVNEIIGHIHDAHGLKGWLLRLMGFAGDEPHIPAAVKMQFRDGRDQLAAQLDRWANRRDLKRIIMSHGEIIEDDPAGALRRLAASLD